jgi:hypothetical protein
MLPNHYFTIEAIMSIPMTNIRRALLLLNLWMHMPGVNSAIEKPSTQKCIATFESFLEDCKDSEVRFFFNWAADANEKERAAENPAFGKIPSGMDHPFREGNELDSESGRRWHEAFCAAATHLGRTYLDDEESKMDSDEVRNAVKANIFEYVFKGSETVWSSGEMDRLWEKGRERVERRTKKKGVPPYAGIAPKGLSPS